MRPALPQTLARLLGDAPLEPVRVGRSGDAVWRVGAHRFLKHGSNAETLGAEAERLDWLVGRVPVPRVVAFERSEAGAFLLTEALRGVAAHEFTGPPARCVELLADGLRRLHAIGIAACPFDARLAVRMREARANAMAGRVDETDFDAARAGRSATDLLAELEATRPADEDLVVAHGDYCLPNVVLCGDRVGGFVDVGRAGIADRHADLALAARSIAYNLGSDRVAPFFAAYGTAPDPAKIAFYQLLDEFF